MLKATIEENGDFLANVIPCCAVNGKTMEMDEENGKKLYDYLNSIATNCYIDDNGFVKEEN